MKVVQATVRVLSTLDDTPLVEGLPEPSDHTGPREIVTVELRADEGLTGLGVTFWHGAFAPALRAAVRALADLSVGEDPTDPERIAAKCRSAVGRTSALGNGMFHLALAAVDIACWDIKAKAAGAPLARLIGGARDRVPAYASGALLRGYPLDVLERAARTLVAMGFRQVKTQAALNEPESELLERMRVVRDSIGSSVDLMIDVNQCWTVDEAIRYGHALETCDLYWIEDPTDPDDLEGLTRIARELPTRLTAGEYCYGVAGLHRLMDAHAAKIVMIDVFRVGGVTSFVKAAAMADALGLPVVSHRIPELNVQLIAGVPNGLTVEYRPMTSGVFEEVPVLRDGLLHVPERPGHGLALDAAAASRWGVS